MSRCKECVYFAPGEPQYHGGNCNRYPPKLFFAHDDWDSQSPWVKEDEWCGEFKQDVVTSSPPKEDEVTS